MKEHVKYGIIGALAGIANGIFGAGGGLFLVPLFIGWTKMEEKKAFATSVAVILPLSVASLIVFFCRGNAIFGTALPYVIGGILGGEVQAGDVVVIRYEGPKGGPGMQEMLYPTSYLKSKHLDKACALITDGRFSGGTSGLSIGHVSPEAASGGEIAVVRTGDEIEIDIPGRSIRLAVDDAEIAARMAAQERFRPAGRDRRVPASLRAYARLVSSADKGAVRIVDDNEE